MTTQAAVDREIQQAQQALDDAAKAQDAELSDAAVINRLDCAAFHSVQAVLYAVILSLHPTEEYFAPRLGSYRCRQRFSRRL